MQSQQASGGGKRAVAGQPCIFFQEGKCNLGDRCIHEHICLSKAEFEALKKKRDDAVAAKTAGVGKKAYVALAGKGKHASRSRSPQK